MLYFHLNDSNFLGAKSDIGDIENRFLNCVFSRLSDAKVLINVWSEDPQFSGVEQLQNKKWCLISVDDESNNIEHEEILKLMEEAHSISIPTLNRSLNDLNLHYDFVVKIPNCEVNKKLIDWLAEENLSDIYETICEPNMTLNDIITRIGDELLSIGSEGNTLMIFDPYIFPKKHDVDYKDVFCGIVSRCKSSSVKVFTDLTRVNKGLLNDIKSVLNVNIKIESMTGLHDRWWIIEEEKKGLHFGTSLNGYGKGKISTISSLSDSDVISILNSI